MNRLFWKGVFGILITILLGLFIYAPLAIAYKSGYKNGFNEGHSDGFRMMEQACRMMLEPAKPRKATFKLEVNRLNRLDPAKATWEDIDPGPNFWLMPMFNINEYQPLEAESERTNTYVWPTRCFQVERKKNVVTTKKCD